MNITFPKDYCVYDLETCGLDTATCRVVEIAVRRVVGAEVMDRSWLVKPDSPLSDEELRVCRDVTGIDPAMLEKEGVPLSEALSGFLQASLGLPLVGHNILRYDNVIMNRLLPYGPSPLLPCVDTAALYKASRMGESPKWFEDHHAFGLRVLETRVQGLKFNLAHACASLGIDVTGIQAHRAAGDVEMTDRLYRKLALGL